MLNVRVLIVDAPRTFRSGTRGFNFRDIFDWNGKRWGLRFQAFEGVETETTHGTLTSVDRLEAKVAPSPGSSLSHLFDKLKQTAERKRAGWHVNRIADGVQARFDLNDIRKLPKGKMGSFASFNIEIGGVRYMCHFHVAEQAQTSSKPTDWDWSRGARAGLPTLGKRR